MATLYTISKICFRFVGFTCVRPVVLHPERFHVPGGFILACSHVSHLEPFIVSTLVDRRIDWMARIEFYRYHIFAAMLREYDAFPVNRQGVPVRAIRTAIERSRAGRVVGIFPEGGVARGRESILRGGPIKKGVCVIAYRAALPVLPVIMLGTEKLNCVGPWLPFRRARIWINFGRLVYPRLDEPRRRVARHLMADDLGAEFQAIYKELCRTCGIDDRDVP
ncbi:MAG TPA: lysophospholipid acyltransferase family protein [Tepidisphaeraceae bacterium]|jgi:1-acyl-sn-glycerol-3-phosphate acyltransferase|nr:lysophospholipid acyltransferase family protein [Tepidisphaeraceae bacterium]